MRKCGRWGWSRHASRHTLVLARSFRAGEVSEIVRDGDLAVSSAGGPATAGAGAATQSQGAFDCDGGDRGRVRLPAIWTGQGAAGVRGPGQHPGSGGPGRNDVGYFAATRRVISLTPAAVSGMFLCCEFAQERGCRARLGRAACPPRRADRAAAAGRGVRVRHAGRAAPQMREGGVPVRPGRTARPVQVPAGSRPPGLRARRAGRDSGAACGGLRAAAGPAGAGRSPRSTSNCWPAASWTRR